MHRASMCSVRFTANARTLGTYKADTIRSHRHQILADAGLGALDSVGPDSNGFGSGGSTGYTELVGSAETAPKNVAYLPRIHV